MQKTRPIKVLMAQFPLESHSRGLITVSGMLKDAGMEVVLIGNELPERIIDTAVQEDVDVIGISTYCGGELALGTDLMQAAAERGIKDRTVFLIGGIFPPQNIEKLKKLGFSGTFLTATKEEITDCINEAISARRN
ncbi:cobalamin B12-binding domain-containing protein [Chloroflexota bacterium]